MNWLKKICKSVRECWSFGLWLLWTSAWPAVILCLALHSYGGSASSVSGFMIMLFVPRTMVSEMSRWDRRKFLRFREIFWSVLAISVIELAVCWAILQGSPFIPWERDFSDASLLDNSWDVGILWFGGLFVELAVVLWERKINSVSLDQPRPVLRA